MKPFKMFSRLTLGLVFSSLAVVQVATADHVLKIHRQTELRKTDGDLVHAAEGEGRIYLGAGRARFDQGDLTSWILLAESNRLLIVHHGERNYQELQLPVRLEDYFDAEERDDLQALEKGIGVMAPFQLTAEESKIGPWQARKAVLEDTPPEGGSSYTYEVWLAELGIDLDLYQELSRNAGALNLALRGLADRMAGMSGFPVRRRSVVRGAGSYEVDDRKLESVEEREVPASVYGPPEGYIRIPFDVEQWFRFGGSGSAPDAEAVSGGE